MFAITPLGVCDQLLHYLPCKAVVMELFQLMEYLGAFHAMLLYLHIAMDRMLLANAVGHRIVLPRDSSCTQFILSPTQSSPVPSPLLQAYFQENIMHASFMISSVI